MGNCPFDLKLKIKSIFKLVVIIVFLFFRLKEVLFSQEQLYLVFEYLEYDLKKYMKKKGAALPP